MKGQARPQSSQLQKIAEEHLHCDNISFSFTKEAKNKKNNNNSLIWTVWKKQKYSENPESRNLVHPLKRLVYVYDEK